MNESTAKKFLMKVFLSAYVSENFFNAIKQIGINFLSWPNLKLFENAKSFWKIACEKSHAAALIQLDIKIEDDDFVTEITIEEVKLYYDQSLNYLRTIDLVRELRLRPQDSIKICNTFLSQKTSTSKFSSLYELTRDFVEKNEEKIKSGDQKVILSDFKTLSESISGFNKGRVSIFTANSGFGKTNLGLNFLRSIINDDKSSLYINMEMEPFDMTKRFLQATCKMNSWEFSKQDYISKVTTGVIDKTKQLEKNFVTDGSSLSIYEIKSMIQEINRKNKLDFVIVDYDQKIIMDDFGIKEEWQYVKKAVEVLESIAKSDMVHVILFAQTNEDSAGAPISSRRSIQPASAVIHFTKEDTDIVFKFIKNRFGSTSDKILLNYSPEISLISEVGYKKEIALPPTQPNRKFAGRF